MDFFAEYEKLKRSIPRCALFNIAGQNSDYCAYGRYNKNCYICRGADYNQDLMYAYWCYHNRDCVDCSYIYDSELLYECIDCKKCYNLNHCQDCVDSYDSKFLYNCYGCKNCYGCANLKQAEFQIFNKKYSREDYEQKIKEYESAPIEGQIVRFAEFLSAYPRVFMHQLQNQNCAGDYVYHGKNCYACYDVQDAEDCIYLSHTLKVKDCVDGNFLYGAQMSYECVSVDGFNCNFCYVVWESSDMEFCELCFNCKNCFGCIGLKSRQYHILNKPFSREEYSKITDEIKNTLRTQKKYNGSLPQIFFEG